MIVTTGVQKVGSIEHKILDWNSSALYKNYSSSCIEFYLLFWKKSIYKYPIYWIWYIYTTTLQYYNTFEIYYNATEFYSVELRLSQGVFFSFFSDII